MKTIFICSLAFFLCATSKASDANKSSLDIHVIDTCGGKAVIINSPDGKTMLIDAGYPRPDNRDTNRVIKTAESLGIKQFDYVVATHYDADHSGNIPSVDTIIPGKVFIDHGEPYPTATQRNNEQFYDPYVKAIGERKRLLAKPGDTIDMGDLKITVVTSGGKVIDKPLPGAGRPNKFCEGITRPEYQDAYDNAGSVGMLFEFGKFRMLDLGDLLSPVEYDLMCPDNKIGKVDLFMVSHHGFKVSNSKFLIHAIAPKVAIMNNGSRKGGEPEVFDILKSSPGIEDLWQLHLSTSAGEKNAPEDLIANPVKSDRDCQGHSMKVSVQPDGTFTVTNLRNNFTKTYKPKQKTAG